MSDANLDEELRAVVFARLHELRERYADSIPSPELNAGVQFRGTRVPIWNHMRGIFRPGVLGSDGAALSIHTSIDSPYDDSPDPTGGQFIYKYQGTDPQAPDNVALRRARARQLPLVYFLATDPGIYDAIFPVYVVGEAERQHQFFIAADEEWVLAGVSATSDPQVIGARRAYRTRAVMERRHQRDFRQLVLKVYRERCAICRLGHRQLLDAAHIIEDRDPRGDPLITNGLSLCKIHHSAYDADIVGIDPDARIHVRRDILDEIDGPMLRHGLQEVHGERLILPRLLRNRPNRDFLAERFHRFQAA